MNSFTERGGGSLEQADARQRRAESDIRRQMFIGKKDSRVTRICLNAPRFSESMHKA